MPTQLVKSRIHVLTLLALAGVTGCSSAPRTSSAAQRNFDAASQKLTEPGEAGRGATPQATAMAAGVAKDMNLEGPATVWCELHRTYCAFLIYAPEDKFDKTFVESAWSAALGQLDDQFPGQDLDLAVAIRGAEVYGPIQVGKSETDITPHRFDGQPQAIHRFFVRPDDLREAR